MASQFSISFWCRAPFYKSVSIYGMKLKLGPVIDRDKKIKQITSITWLRWLSSCDQLIKELINFCQDATPLHLMSFNTMTGSSKIEKFRKMHVNLRKWQFKHVRILPCPIGTAKISIKNICGRVKSLCENYRLLLRCIHHVYSCVYPRLFLLIFM